MKKGDIIQCRDQKDLLNNMRYLSAAGFHAVKDSGDNFDIVITGVPKTSYIVQVRDQNGRCQNAYCDTLEEAEEIATEYGNSYEFVEILKGYAGEWESVAQSW